MSDTILYTIISLSALGVVMALILYVVAQKFKVIEDPRIDEVDEALPGANCGGCGYPGCRGFAEACVKADNLDGLFCPVGGNDTTKAIASILGMEAVEKEPQVAVIRCSGTPENSKRINKYDGPASCQIATSLSMGETGCPNSCLGLGDCVNVCTFDAIYVDEKTGLPVVSEENCTACGACVTACPRDIIELRNVGKKSRRIFVSCVNTEKGAVAKKNCSVACIGCGKCAKVCPFDAIEVKDFCAYIDFEKCKLCRKCVPECPTNAIHELNFPPKKVKPAAATEEKKEAVKKEEKPAEVKEAPKAEKENNDNNNSDNK